MKENIFNKIGNYSSAIVAFVVIQGLTYSFYFGSNQVFNCIIHNGKFLAEALSILFVVVAILCSHAIRSLGSIESSLASEYEHIIKQLTKGKVTVVLIFGLFPALLTLFYGVLGETPAICQ